MKIYNESTSKINTIFLKELFLVRGIIVILFLNQIITKQTSKKNADTFLNAIVPGIDNTKTSKEKTPRIKLLISLYH
jgi:hypothetical protein